MGMQKSWCEPAGKKYGKLTSAKKYGYRKRFADVKGIIVYSKFVLDNNN
jgi:hypothetical protein